MNTSLKKVIRIEANVLLVLAVAMLCPMLLALARGEIAARNAFLITSGLSFIIGIMILLLTSPAHTKLKARDSFLVVSLSWLVLILVGSAPFYISGAVPSIIDALFESCSGFTTTGANIVTGISALPVSIIFWRSLTEWLGGMGIIVFVMMMLPILGSSGQISASLDMSATAGGKLFARFSDSAISLLKIYIFFTIVETMLLICGGLEPIDALMATFGTVSTGGFSTQTGNFIDASGYVKAIILIFMLLSGINYNLYFSLMRGVKAFFRDGELRFYLGIIGIASLLIFIGNYAPLRFGAQLGSSGDFAASIAQAPSAASMFFDSFFQTISVMSTTGFVSTDYTHWSAFSAMILFCLFFFGGCSCSAASGIKCIRILVSLKLIRRSVSLKLHPNRIAPLTLGGGEVATDVVINITNFIFTYIALAFAGILMLSLDNLDFETTISACISCIANIGLGFGQIGASHDFSCFSTFGKFVCMALMIVGRLGVVTVIALFSKYYRHSNKVR